MPTLDELLGHTLDVNTAKMSDLESIFSTKDIRNAGGIDPGGYKADYSVFDTPADYEIPEEKSAALELVGQTLWQGLDTALFGLPGLGIEKLAPGTTEEYLTPTTKAGKVGAAVGGTLGFVWGAPMKLGAKAAQLAAKPFIKKAGYETLQKQVKKSIQAVNAGAKEGEFASKAAKSILNKDLGKKLAGLAHKSRWDQAAGKGVAKNWADTSTKAINQITSLAVKNKDLTSGEAALIVKSFKNNLTTRPMQDIVDIIMKRHPNKFGFVAGSAIHEAVMFGLIDAAMEGVHSTKEGRDYDPFAPLWGVGIGAAFGGLKLLPAAGKSSITSNDFMSGFKGVFAKNPYKTMSHDKLFGNAKIIGDSFKSNKALFEMSETGVNRTPWIIEHGGYTINLTNPKSIGGLSETEAAKVLRGALSKERVRFGKQMMKESVKEDFKSTLANWKRVIGGTVIMNARTILDMHRGHEIPPEDIMTSILIGAFINRKGRPKDPEMNLAKMQRIRNGLNAYGETQYAMLDMIPTLRRGQHEHIQPLTDVSFKSLRKKSEDLMLVHETPEAVETMSKDGSPSLASSQRAFPLFDEFYMYLDGSRGKKYIKPKALVTEKEAKEIETTIRSLEFEGTKVNDITEFRSMLQAGTNNITDKLEYLVKQGVHNAGNSVIDVAINSPELSNIGTVPEKISINQSLINRIKAGNVEFAGGGKLSVEESLNAIAKFQKLLDFSNSARLSSANQKKPLWEVTTGREIRDIIEHIKNSEKDINTLFNIGRDNLKFSLNDLDLVAPQIIMRNVSKSIDKFSKIFDDVDNPDFIELRNILYKMGLSKKEIDSKDNIFDIIPPFHKITIKKTEEGFRGDKEEAILRTVLGILGAKGNRSIKTDPLAKEITINPADVQSLEMFLNKSGLNTDVEMLDYFRSTVTQKVFSDIVKDSKVNQRDINVLSELADLGVPLSTYSPMAEGGTGFSVSKIEYIGPRYRTYVDAVKEYNKYIDDLVNVRGVNKEGKSWISESRQIIQADRHDVKIIRDIIRRKNAQTSQEAQEAVIDFVKAMEPTDTIRHGLIKYLQNSERPETLLNFMLGNGMVSTKKRDNIIKYVFDQKAINDNKDELKDFMSKYGVHLNDIQKLENQVDMEINTLNDMKIKKESGAISQQRFFEKYWPGEGGFGSQHQEASVQNEIIQKALYRSDKVGLYRDNPVENLMTTMSFKVGKDSGGKDIIVDGKTLIKKKQITSYKRKYDEAVDDIQKILVHRAGAEQVTVLEAKSGSMAESSKIIQKNYFTEFLKENDIPFFFTSGDIYSRHFFGNKITASKINVFEVESSVSNENINKNIPKVAKSMVKDFQNQLLNYEITGSEGTMKGLKPISMGNAKDVLLVPMDYHAKVTELFNKKIYDVYLKKAKAAKDTKAVNKLESMKETLDKSTTWGESHVDAMRSIVIAEMTKGKDVDNFLNVIHGRDLEDIGKRFSLYNTPSFKRIDRSLVKKLSKVRTGKDKTLLEAFSKRKINFVEWNDKDYARIFDRKVVKDAFKKAEIKIEDMIGSRENESGFDSISFISKDFKRFLELYYGVASRDGGDGSAVFKPIISSGGKDMYMFAKTVFVYDPDMQIDVFNKNKNLDVFLTRSADKMKSGISEVESRNLGNPDRPVYIDKTVEQIVNSKQGELLKYMKSIPMKGIGVSTIPENRMAGSNSISLTNYMTSSEAGEFFNSYQAPHLTRVLGNVGVTASEGLAQKFMGDSMWRRLALLKLNQLNPNITMEQMQNSPEGLKNLGAHLQLAAMGADPMMMGPDVLVNTIKKQFIDPIISPKLETPDGELMGGKFVLKQSFKFRDLAPTVRKGEKDKTEILPGEIYLPNYAETLPIDFKNPDMEIKVIDSKGRGIDKNLKQTMESLLISVDGLKKGKDVDEYFEFLSQNGTLGFLHSEIKRLDPDLSIGIVSVRYPRTAPNDMAILRLKGFLGKDHGNTGIVNDFDVLNIFEGDYDVDEVDFMHVANRGTWNHISRVKHHWVNTKDPNHYKPPPQGLELMTNGANNSNWNTFDANNRVFRRGIGTVQKTLRLVNHVANLGVKNTEKDSRTFGMNELMKVKDKDGKEFVIAVDYDNADFFNRTALESQLIIDYWKGVNPNITTDMMSWRNEYLFPKWEKSIGKENAASLMDRQANHLLKGPHNSRIRIFRKFGKDGEVPLSSLDREIVQTLMREHSNFLNLEKEVYDGSGQSSSATYKDIIDHGTRYFTHLRNINNKVFYRIRNKMSNHEDYKSYFAPYRRYKSTAEWKLNNYKGKFRDNVEKEIQNEELLDKNQGRYSYKWYDRSPFIGEVLDKAKEISAVGGKQGSVTERIFREIVQKRPLSLDKNGKTETIPDGNLFNQMEFAKSLILDAETHFGKHSNEFLADILPKLTKNVNSDVKIIKYYKRLIDSITRSTDMPQKTKDKRIDALDTYIKEKEANLRDFLPKKYLETGDVKYLETIKKVNISREADILEGTKQLYTLYGPAEMFGPAEHTAEFYNRLKELRSETYERYNEYHSSGQSAPYKDMTFLNSKISKMRSEPLHSIKDIETELMENLSKAYDDFKMPFLYQYAMPTAAETTIGVFEGTPLAVATKPSSRFKRVLRLLVDKHNTATNKQEKLHFKEVLENLSARYTAYSNMFDKNFSLIPLADQDVLGMINNVPGFSKRLVGTFDRYESFKVDKNMFSRDVFGMGAEYDSHVSFFRRLLGDAFGKKQESNVKELGEVLSYTHQLAMENNYMNPVSYFQMVENVRTRLKKLGLDKPLTTGIDGNTSNKLNPHSLSPELALLAGESGGVSIAPLGLLSKYRMNMLQRFIKQGKDIKKLQKKDGETWEESMTMDRKAGPCIPE